MLMVISIATACVYKEKADNTYGMDHLLNFMQNMLISLWPNMSYGYDTYMDW